MIPTHLEELPRPGRYKVLGIFIFRVALIVTVIITIYFTIPLETRGGQWSAVIKLIVGMAIYGVVMYFEIRGIVRSEYPTLKSAEALALAIVFFLSIFAGVYVELSHISPASFTEHLSRTAALYFTIVTFGTVGYGDIAAKSDVARLIVSIQVLIDLAFLALTVRLILNASKRSLIRRTPEIKKRPVA